MKLIVNADDFGLTKGVNLGIAEGIRQGIVTGTTMIANGREEAFMHGVRLYQEYNLDVGVHLVLTMGVPLSGAVNTLTDEKGRFFKLDQMEVKCMEMDRSEIKTEFMAQINKVRAAGIEITHLDSHHHVHMLPVVSDVYLEIADELNLPVRGFMNKGEETGPAGGRSPQQLTTDFYGNDLTEAALLSLLAGLSGESAEIMCHPAYIDQELMELSRYNMMRARELSILCRREVKEAIGKLGIRLIGYRDFDIV